MSYTVEVRGGKVYSLSDEDAWSLKEALANAKGSIMVELDDDSVRSGNILSITKNKITLADVPNFDAPALPAGPQCHSTNSIQNEINRIAKQSGRGWAKLISDKKWREEQRKKLRAAHPGVLWCDNKAGECACV